MIMSLVTSKRAALQSLSMQLKKHRQTFFPSCCTGQSWNVFFWGSELTAVWFCSHCCKLHFRVSECCCQPIEKTSIPFGSCVKFLVLSKTSLFAYSLSSASGFLRSPVSNGTFWQTACKHLKVGASLLALHWKSSCAKSHYHTPAITSPW